MGLIADQISAGAIAQWPCQDEAATLVQTAASGNDLAITGGSSGAAGPLGGTAVEFNGTSSQYASYSATTTGALANMFASSGYATFEGYISLDLAGNNTNPTILENWAGSGAGTGWIWSLYCSDYFSVAKGILQIQIQTDSGLYQGRANHSAGASLIAEGNGWHHVVMAMQLNNADAGGYAMVDGTEYSLTLQSTGSGTYQDDSTNDMYLGKRYDNSAGRFWDGKLAAIAVYDFKLDTATATAHSEATALSGGSNAAAITKGRRRGANGGGANGARGGGGKAKGRKLSRWNRRRRRL